MSIFNIERLIIIMGFFELLKEEGKAKLSKSQYEKHRQELLERIGEALSGGDGYRAASLYQILARLSLGMGRYETCLEYLMKGAECSERAGKDFNTGWLYRIAGHVALEKKDYTRAVQYALKAAGYFRKTGCTYAVQWSYNLAAEASELKGDLHSAINHYRKSLEIEGDRDIEKRLEALKGKIPRPLIRAYASRESVKEGEGCKFTIRIENRGKGVLKGIRLTDREGRVIEKLDRLCPGDSRAFSYDCSGKLGVLHCRYRHVLWQGPQGVLEMGIVPMDVRVVPNMGVSISINPRLRLGRPSDFVVLIKNRSSSPVFDVRFHMEFPKEIRVRRETRDSFESILPGDEKGIVYTLVPTIVGESIKRGVEIEYRDGDGNKYRESVSPVVFRQALRGEVPPGRTGDEAGNILGPEGLKHLERAGKKRGYIRGLITANPMSEGGYLALAGRLNSCSRGFSLGGVGMDTISSHILEECRVLTLIGMRELRHERLFLFAGRSQTGMRVYLLTAAVKKDGDIFNVLFKAYSDRKEGLEEFLDNIADIVKYTIITMNFAKEVERIEIKKVINIIDSIVQRSNIGGGRGELKSRELTIKDSVVQRSGV